MIETNGNLAGPRISESGFLDIYTPGNRLVVKDGSICHLVAIMDERTRLAWGQAVEDLEGLTVMFAAMKSINYFLVKYDLRFISFMTDDRPELACPDAVDGHPVERMMKELFIEHRYARRPGFRDNGKMKRLWRTINEEFLDRYYFESAEQLRDALPDYFVHYNEVRPHHALGYDTPAKALESL